jgi:hypothetical protein
MSSWWLHHQLETNSKDFSKNTTADFTTQNGGFSNNVHQVCVIITEVAEDNDSVITYYEDEEKEMGTLCFTRRVRRTRIPKGFKLPHDQQKYDGSQEPKLWLSDYLQAVQILGGSRATTMQSLQLHLTSVTRSWLGTLPDDSIGSWGELESQFTRNFRSTYK